MRFYFMRKVWVMNFPFIDLKAQYNAYKDEIDTAIAGVLQSTSFIGGAALDEFEANLAKYVGVKNAIGCSSGTSALVLALLALNITQGDEVIVPSFTFIATAEMVSLLGATPVFADISLDDYNVSVESIKHLVSEKTKAVIAVSIFGQMPDLLALNEFCKSKNIVLIEDGAQSFGATQDIGGGGVEKVLFHCPTFLHELFSVKTFGRVWRRWGCFYQR